MLSTFLSMLIHKKPDKAVAVQGSFNSSVVVLQGDMISCLSSSAAESLLGTLC